MRGSAFFRCLDPHDGFEPHRNMDAMKSITYKQRVLAASTFPSAITQNCEQLPWSPLHPAGADKILSDTGSYKLSSLTGHLRIFANEPAASINARENADPATPRLITKRCISGTRQKASIVRLGAQIPYLWAICSFPTGRIASTTAGLMEAISKASMSSNR